MNVSVLQRLRTHGLGSSTGTPVPEPVGPAVPAVPLPRRDESAAAATRGQGRHRADPARTAAARAIAGRAGALIKDAGRPAAEGRLAGARTAAVAVAAAATRAGSRVKEAAGRGIARNGQRQGVPAPVVPSAPQVREPEAAPEVRLLQAAGPTGSPASVGPGVDSLQRRPATPAASGGRLLSGRRRALVAGGGIVALVGGGLVAVGASGAQARGPAAGSATGNSVSVAQQLGLPAPDAHLGGAAAAEELGALAASRAQREAEQGAAVQVQDAADQVAVQAAQAAADTAAQAAQAAAETAAEAARPRTVLPVAGAQLTSTFGPRWGVLHADIDFAAPIGTPEYAAADGVVLRAGPASGFGMAVYVRHNNGDVTVYGHMRTVLVRPGQSVRAGDTIALLGNEGQSTGPHLHFEVHAGGVDGPAVDPVPWLRGRGVAL